MSDTDRETTGKGDQHGQTHEATDTSAIMNKISLCQVRLVKHFSASYYRYISPCLKAVDSQKTYFFYCTQFSNRGSTPTPPQSQGPKKYLPPK
eukprot:1462871-Amphidinium_carterae.1